MELTLLEQMLKERFLLRFPKESPLLTQGEMRDYMEWLIETRPKDSEIPLGDPSLLASMQQINRGGVPELDKFYKAQSEHSEARYLAESHDVSVGRMFRFMPAHWHANDFFEMYYCAGGECPILFENDTVTLLRGDVMIIAPGEVHASPCYTDDAILYYYLVRSSTFEKVFWNQLPTDSLMAGFFRRALGQRKHAAYLQFSTGADEELERLLARIEAEAQSSEPYGAQMMNVLLSAFFILLLRRYEGTAKLPRTGDFYWSHRFSAVFSYLQQHYADRTLADIAAEFHYSERQINRIVRNATGENFQHLVMRLKMEQAAVLLRRQELSMDAIAERVGYADVPGFLRAFKAYHGTTPARYRKETVESASS